MQVTVFIGIDVSKGWIDVALSMKRHPKKFILAKFANKQAGFESMLKWIQKQLNSTSVTGCIFGLEHTGHYSYPLSVFLAEKDVSMYLLSPVELKYSSGIQRGKSDPEDAKRIASYIRKNHMDLNPSKPMSSELKTLQVLFSERNSLVKDRTAARNRVEGLMQVLGNEVITNILINKRTHIAQLTARIKTLEKMIQDHINQYPALKRNAELVQSVPGIGLITATYMLVTTHNFTRFDTWRKYASYCGTAPFSHQSGSSLNRTKRVNHFANKTMKRLLFTAASSVIQHDFELKQFYERKTQEGKPSLWIMNAIKNKILSRVFAVIKRGSEYKSVDQYQAWKQVA